MRVSTAVMVRPRDLCGFEGADKMRKRSEVSQKHLDCEARGQDARRMPSGGRKSAAAIESKLCMVSGDNSLRDPPVPIPNTEVKPQHADGTWLATARESRTPPDPNSAVEFRLHCDMP